MGLLQGSEAPLVQHMDAFRPPQVPRNSKQRLILYSQQEEKRGKSYGVP